MSPHGVLPLLGRTVVVTRAEGVDGPLTRALETLGARVLLHPLLEVHEPDDDAPLLAAIERLDEFDWLVLTSPRAVDALEDRNAFEGAPPPRLRVAAVGARTAEAIEDAGWPVHLVPDPAGAGPLLAELHAAGVGPAHRVLFPASSRARPLLAEGLREFGVEVCQLVAYEPAAIHADAGLVDGLLDADALAFTSPSALEALTDALDANQLGSLTDRLVGVQGPTTAAAACEAGFTNIVEAEPRTFEGLARALAAAFAAPDRPRIPS